MKYRKKPVEVEARQFDGHNHGAIVEWIGGDAYAQITHYVAGEPRYSIYLPTLEGEMRADRGDIIIQGVQGEFYPCKPDIFWATYEEVTE